MRFLAFGDCMNLSCENGSGGKFAVLRRHWYEVKGLRRSLKRMVENQTKEPEEIGKEGMKVSAGTQSNDLHE